jgi:hypothetical protein
MNTKVLSFQLVIFFKDIITRPDKDFRILIDEMSDLFDAIPNIMSVPQEFPPEIPIIHLRSEDSSYQCNISRSRIDFFLNLGEGQKYNQTVVINFYDNVLKLVGKISNTKVVRIGLISRYFFEEKNAINSIKSKYFKALGEVTELNLRYNRPIKLNHLNVNDVVEIGATNSDSGSAINGILIQRDVNNVLDDKRILSADELKKVLEEFFKMLTQESIEGLVQ